ncbi:MAG: hypothetical protein EPO68_16820 [Planctomycetota bacterium]|nr:MAG: hypothetical protein EPO68_16820 [Planctomycetota bacterium]
MTFHRSASFLPALCALTLAPISAAQLLAYDGFGGPPTPQLAGNNGGTGWPSAWSSVSTDPTGIAGPGLQYPGLATSAGAAVTPVASGIWPSSVYQRALPALPPGTTALYVSFLLRDDAGWGIWSGLSFGQYPAKMTVGSPLGWYTYGLMVSEGLGDASSKPLVTGETTLVVLKIAKAASGTGSVYSMYLDPVIGSAEPGFPAASFALGTGFPTALSIDNGTGVTTDEIRVGTTWSSVLPAQPPIWIDMGFAKPGISGAPHLVGTGALTAGSSTRLTLSNAHPLAPAWLAIGGQALDLPILGGVLVPEPTLIIGQTTTPTGSASFQAPWPASIPAGQSLYFQYWIQDPAATFGFAASNGLRAIAQ